MLQTLDAKVDPRVAALLIIDVQNDFCHDDGALGKAGRNVRVVREVVPRVEHVLEQARKTGVPVIHVRMSTSPLTKSEAYIEHSIRKTGKDGKVCEEGSWGAEFYQIKPAPGEAIVTKLRYSAFVSTNLETILRAKGVKTVILTGVTTDVCVESAARDAYMRDYYVVFLSDCTGVDDPAVQKGTEERVTRYFGQVAKSDEVLAAWERHRTVAR